MQAALGFPLHDWSSIEAAAWTSVLGRISPADRSSARAPENMFRLIVRCTPSQKNIEPLLRQALAENLIALRQRVTTLTSGRALWTVEAIARSVRVSRCQVVALMGQLQEAGVRDVRWESVLG